MTYQVLARKWRPQDFSSLIGQEAIVTALRNAITEERIAQAYVFSGIRGVGKTTTARVLAKALNCEQRGDSPDPCNTCPPCREITAGNDLDVLEIDAATYSKVEQVRELTESLRYGAARDRYKVVVLDEVHRLSRQAFDALLKIVEEPPPHLVFIFATTEIDAVPATILSRCQEFHFRRVTQPVLAAHLRTLCDAEEITASDAALGLIARAGEGSVRDAIALLDQMATFGGGRIEDQAAKDLLGGFDNTVFLRLLEGLLEGDRQAVIDVVREAESQGWDPYHVYGQFLAFLRQALHFGAGGGTDSSELPKEDADALASLVRDVPYENLLRLSQTILGGEPVVRRSEFALLALEIIWLRAAELPKLTHIEDVLAGKVPLSLPPQPTAVPAAAAPRPKAGSTGDKASTPATQADPVAEASDPGETVIPSQGGSSSAVSLDRLRRSLSDRRGSLAAHFEQASLEHNGRELWIYPPAGDQLLASALERKANREALEAVLQEVFGSAEWKLKRSKASATVSGPSSSGQEPPAVQAVLDIFDGTIEDVRPID